MFAKIISVGGLYLNQIEETRNSQYSNGQISINGSRTGLALSDFLLGEVATIIQGYDGVMNDRKHYLGVYFQDAWKATPKLTLNYGVRWEPNWPLYNIDKHVSLFDEAAFAAGKKSSVYVNAPAGLTFPGDLGYPGRASTKQGRMTKFFWSAFSRASFRFWSEMRATATMRLRPSRSCLPSLVFIQKTGI